ncbi:beta-ketoacyl-ACP synthase II [Desulfovibrio inopinatus]|uniref:beta-ketoacyl-ACP synthase II n=1 Tax=Desulfovibrio inopinatus TaxID=102109 RepID=UPI000412C9EF|nr:beta-ketoacyl-ACP synthase II [Desulfovibrio inopinatus]
MSTHRVVVTGLGAVTPVGADLETSWSQLIAGESGVYPIECFNAEAFETRFAAQCKEFDPAKFIEKKQVRRMDRFTQFAVAAAAMALENANWSIPPENAHRVGTIIGCGLGGLDTIEHYHKILLEKGPNRVSPFFIPVLIANMAAAQVSISTGAKGPNLAATSACASGVHAIGYAYSDIKLGRCDAMICGGTESTITPLAVSGFNALKALSTRNDDMKKASRPFDKDRDGFVIGEGCGILIIESLEHAQARGANILAEVVGFGASSDAYHMTAPDEDGAGMALAMQAAIQDAGLTPDDVQHINAHGTSTPLNDSCETKAIKTVFGNRAQDIPVTSNKSMIGHTLGAAGGIESVFSVKTITEGIIPATINLENQDPNCDLNIVGNTSLEKQVDTVLCNSFGFGGTNGCMLFKRFTE